MSASIKDLASTFRRLHAGPALLLLPNAWDAGSARLIESVGAPAITTSSAAEPPLTSRDLNALFREPRP